MTPEALFAWYHSEAKFALDLSAQAVAEPAKPEPEVPPPVWDDRPIDADRAMAAVLALSGG